MIRSAGSAHVRVPTAIAVAALLPLAVAVAPGDGATSKCAKQHEAAGCKLRKGATYKFKDPSDNFATLVQRKGSWSLSYSLVFDCASGAYVGTPAGDNYPTNPRSGTGSGKLEVGKSYSISGEEGGVNEDTGDDERQSWAATVKVKSARKAKLTFTQHRTKNGEVQCDGGGAVKLKRTK